MIVTGRSEGPEVRSEFLSSTSTCLSPASYSAMLSAMSKTVAVVGASNDRRKYGNKALRAFATQGYTVFPINPHQQEIEGHRAYASVLDVPGTDRHGDGLRAAPSRCGGDGQLAAKKIPRCG